MSDLTKYYDELDAFNSRPEQQIADMQSSAARCGISESADIIRERMDKPINCEEFQNMSREEQIQAIIENSNILLSKFAQTFSTDESLPKEVSDLFWVRLIKKCKTNRQCLSD